MVQQVQSAEARGSAGLNAIVARSERTSGADAASGEPERFKASLQAVETCRPDVLSFGSNENLLSGSVYTAQPGAAQTVRMTGTANTSPSTQPAAPVLQESSKSSASLRANGPSDSEGAVPDVSELLVNDGTVTRHTSSDARLTKIEKHAKLPHDGTSSKTPASATGNGTVVPTMAPAGSQSCSTLKKHPKLPDEGTQTKTPADATGSGSVLTVTTATGSQTTVCHVKNVDAAELSGKSVIAPARISAVRESTVSAQGSHKQSVTGEPASDSSAAPGATVSSADVSPTDDMAAAPRARAKMPVGVPTTVSEIQPSAGGAALRSAPDCVLSTSKTIPSASQVAEAMPHGTLRSTTAGLGADEPRMLFAGTRKLEVGVDGGVHGWLRVRAELGHGGEVTASLIAPTASAAAGLGREMGALSAYLKTEALGVSSLQVTTAGRSAGMSGSEAGANPGSGSSTRDGGRNAGSGMRALGIGPGNRDLSSSTLEGSSAAIVAASRMGSGSWLSVRV